MWRINYWGKYPKLTSICPTKNYFSSTSGKAKSTKYEIKLTKTNLNHQETIQKRRKSVSQISHFLIRCKTNKKNPLTII